MIPREIFNSEHNLFRENFRKFIESEITPHHEKWEDQLYVDRDVWLAAGRNGFLCPTVPEEYGGAGVDRMFSTIIIEELVKTGSSGPGFPLHSDIVAPYILNYGTEEQKQAYLPKMASGVCIGAIAMTEPGTGSDLQSVKTKAVRDGDEYVLNGSKIFITNGYNCDLVIVVAQITDPDSGSGNPQMSLLLVDADSEGFSKEKPLKKMGQKAQDTCILNFSDVRVPVANVLGSIGGAIAILFAELAWERMMIAIGAVAGAEFCFNEALNYSKEREAFGRKIGKFQNMRFKLAEMKTKLSIGQVYVDRCLELVLKNELTPENAAMAKYWTSEMASEVADEAVQIHGGYGYMWEYPVARAYTDVRALRIYGGTTEIMKEIISRGF